MAAQTCPECGKAVPPEVGQHAMTPSADVVACPHCGATMTLAKPDQGDAGKTAREDTFAGHETIEGVMDEVSKKEAG
jgi:hypothetical protein